MWKLLDRCCGHVAPHSRPQKAVNRMKTILESGPYRKRPRQERYMWVNTMAVGVLCWAILGSFSTYAAAQGTREVVNTQVERKVDVSTQIARVSDVHKYCIELSCYKYSPSGCRLYFKRIRCWDFLFCGEIQSCFFAVLWPMFHSPASHGVSAASRSVFIFASTYT